MLARAGEPTGPAATAASTEEIRHATELRLSRAVEEMLEHSLGPGRVRAEAAVEMDFDRVNETQERYDPDGQVVRSQQSVNSNSRSTETQNTVSVQNNLPNADQGNNAAGSQEGRQEETTNYEIGRTVRTLIREQPQIRRISLAVMVDGTEAAGGDGKPAWTPRSNEELGRITGLVRSAIGFDEKRGDHVEVVSMKFAGMEEAPAREPAGVFGLPLERTDLLRLAQTALLGLVGVLALLFVLRPMVLRLTTAPQASLADDAAALVDGNPRSPGAAAVAALPGGASSAALASNAYPGLLEDESMVNVANVEGQMRASSIRRLTELVEKHPEASLSIVRGWIVQDAS